MRFRVLSRREVEAGGADSADAVVSIRPRRPSPEDELDLAIAQAVEGDLEAVLVLRFDDIGLERHDRFVGPALEDVDRLLAFGRAVGEGHDDPLVVLHCQAGVSRSMAAALLLLADRLGLGREQEAVRAWRALDLEGRACPNPRLVMLGDAALLRLGRLEAALAEGCPAYRIARDGWRWLAAGGPAAVPQRRARGRRG